MRLSMVILLALLLQLPLTAATGSVQIGGGTCSNATVSGTYFYLLDGEVSSGGEVVAYAVFGKLIANGAGQFSGNDYESLNGQQASYSFSGTYTVQSNCAGSMTYTINSQTITLTFQVVNNGEDAFLAVSTPGTVVTGAAHRTTAATTAITCGTGSLSGGYGYLLNGIAAGSVYSDAGQFVADGNGNGSVTSVANLDGTVAQLNGSGTYTVAGDCSGTASVTSQSATANYRFAIVKDGQEALFFETDSGRAVVGTFTPIFAAPQASVVNGASFEPSVAPGSLFSIFGADLATQQASASTIPLPRNLSGTQVMVNGEQAPLVYVSNTQINAQMPIDVPTGVPVTITVTNGSTTSNAVAVRIPPAGPGIFTYDGNLAVVQNPNGSVNGPSSPAHVGDVLVAYLTGGGAVSATGPWTTGAASPGGLSSVNTTYSITIGGVAAQVEYLGLTPGLVGLYQANFTVPAMTPGSYPLVVTVDGVSSNAAMVAVGG